MTGTAAMAAHSILNALAWWAGLLAMGAVSWLALRPALARWQDAGWSVARGLGPLAFASLFWTAGHAAPVLQPTTLRLAALALAAAVVVMRRRSLTVDARDLRRIAAAEARFLLPFAVYCAMRGFNHDIVGLEKFMDFGFVNASMRSASLPVPDPWFAGEPINYYYFGHYYTALLARLFGTPPEYAYNLMLATLFGSVFQLAWSLVAELTRSLGPRVSASASLLAATWLVAAGNVHAFYYGFVEPWLVDAGWVARPAQPFMLSDSTRFVGWNPPTGDRLIHEFPAYAFYVGDLHAHVLDLPWVLLFLCVLFAGLRAREGSVAARAWIAAAAWLVGIFVAANTWDALMYGGILAAVLFARMAWAAATHGAVRAALLDALLAGVVAAASAWPFLLHFQAGARGFGWTHSHTPLRQWLVLYGLQLALAAMGMLLAVRARASTRPGTAATVMLLTMTTAGFAFALVPEAAYLEDIYGAEFYRANTAFKFGFQAFSLLTLAGSAGVAYLIVAWSRSVARTLVVVALEVALVPPLYYAYFVVQATFAGWREREWTLDGQRHLARSHPEDRRVVEWLRAQPEARAVLVEANADDFTLGARISANTGIPTVLGWPAHEQLWRDNTPAVWARRDDVDRLYGATSRAVAQDIVRRYGVRWLVVGRLERERYPDLDAGLLASLGCVTLRDGATFVVDLQPLRAAPGVRPACEPAARLREHRLRG